MGIFQQFPYSNFHEINLDEIIKIVKNMLEEWATYYTTWDNWKETVTSEWAEMQSFINNYFDNLNVQTEINNKITDMVSSGEFSQIVDPYIPPAVSSWLAEYITEPVGVVIDASLTVSGACADAKAAGDGINKKVDLNGENQVTPQNIEGVTFTRATIDIPGPDIFTPDMLFENDYYVSVNTGVTPPVITHSYNTLFKTYCVPVDGVSKYSFTTPRFACLATGNTMGSEAVGTTLDYPTSVRTTGASYLFLSYNTNITPGTPEIHKITEQYEYSDFGMPEWSGIPTLQSSVYDLEYLNGVNLFSHAELLYEDGYAVITDGHISNMTPLAGYNTYLIPVDGKSPYTFTACRFAFLVDSDKYTAIGDLLENITRLDSTGASYICFSFNRNLWPLSAYEVFGLQRISNKSKYTQITGNLTNGQKLTLADPKTNLRKGERLVFEGDISSFTSLTIGLTTNGSYYTNYFEIDHTNITYHATSASTPVVVAHGLTLSENIQIICEMSATASCNFTLISDGNIYTHEFYFSRQTNSYPFVLSTNSALSNCKLSWTCKDLNKMIWLFGDSYIQYSPARWAYYLHEYGYDNNCLLDGFAGEGGTNGRVAFTNLLKYGTPNIAVWCLGMNDNSDSETEPSSNWVIARDNFLNFCNSNNITPVFGTIPTVPTINHEQKNEWIRSSGYRYIDFAKAVGANSSGVWYSGMLSSDNVHPTEQGARALFARVLLDLPEIMIDDYEY